MTISKSVIGAKSVLSAALILLVSYAPQAMAIKKCQDADGKWHYGDVAVKECERSKVTTLNNRGFIKDEDDAPKSKEELEAERTAKAEADRKKEEEMKRIEERNRILSVYQSESDIDRQRDNQIYSVDSNIAVHEVYIKNMKAKVVRLEEKASTARGRSLERTQNEIKTSLAKIDDSEKELESLKKQRQQIEDRFAREKELYRTLRDEAAAS